MNDYRRHVRQLAADLGCEAREVPGMDGGMMYVEFGYVESFPVVDLKSYLVMLHELGHFAHNHTQGRPPKNHERFYFTNGVLRSEAEAWNWALDRCQHPLTPEVRRFMWDTCLGSYYRCYLSARGSSQRLGNGNRHHVLFVFDHPDEYFAQTVRRIQGDLDQYKVAYVGRYDEASGVHSRSGKQRNEDAHRVLHDARLLRRLRPHAAAG